MQFGLIITAVAMGMVIAGLLGWILWKPLSNLWIDSFVKRLLQDPYLENIGEMYNVFRKVGVQNVLETDIRGATGEALQRPFGTPNHYSKWDQLLLNPVYLSRKPVVESIGIQTKVTIGPKAKKPLEIDMPLMIAGMSWGIGLSTKAKLALAIGASQVKTAINSGTGPCFPEERKRTGKLIIQYHRGEWGKEEEWLRQADAIEIQLGYGALASAPFTVKSQDTGVDFLDQMNIIAGEKLNMSSKMVNLNQDLELIEVIRYLRKLTGGVPIGVKIGATHYLEEELEIITAAGIDFLTIDGKEAGIHFGPGILADDVGLPTLPGLCRAAAFLKNKQLKSKISLIVSGGLATPGQFLKALALGADAIYAGTIVLVALAHKQIIKVLPWEPLSQLLYEKGRWKDKFSIEQGAQSVTNFLKSCNEEIILAMRSLGKTSISQLNTADLCALTREMSQMSGAELAYGKITPGFPGKPEW